MHEVSGKSISEEQKGLRGMKQSGFPRLDAATGGFLARKTHVLYGTASTGKTAFCLSYLREGLRNGESAVLVTAHKPQLVLEIADAYGWDLRSFLQTRKFRIFEYPENIQQMAAAAPDLSQVVAELQDLLGSEPVDRIVLDPITPLLEGSATMTLHRCRSVLQPIAALNAATLVVMDATKASAALTYCKDLASTVLRFAAPGSPGGPRYLRLERHIDKPEAEGLFRFELQPGVGFVDAEEPPAPVLPIRPALARPRVEAAKERRLIAPVRALPPAIGTGEPRVLVVDPDPGRRGLLRAALQKSFTVLEACGSTDAMTLYAAGAPGAMVLALDLEGESGMEVVCKFRQTGCNLPIVCLGDAPAIHEHVSALAAGADVCLTNPVDGRILRLTVFNALCRRGDAKRMEQPPLPAAVAGTGPEPTSSAADLSALYARLAREVAYAQAKEGRFVVLTMRLDAENRFREQLASLAVSLLRPADMVFVGERGVACMLTESDSAQPFLSAFWNHWRTNPAPELNELCFDGQDGFLDAARDFVLMEIDEPVEAMAMAARQGGVARFEGSPIAGMRPGDDGSTVTLRKAGYFHE